jgi:hypothetical protein
VTFKDLWVFRHVKFVNVDYALIRQSEEMATMREFDFTALLHQDVFVRKQSGLGRFLEKVHHANSLTKPNNQVESAGVERNTVRLFWELSINL